MSHNEVGLLKSNGQIEKYGSTAGGGGGDSLGEQHTVTGNPLSFTTDSTQVSNKTIVSLEPIQAGSGDPSPSNVRTISGYDSIDISVSDEYLDGYTVEQGGIDGSDTSITKNDSANRVKVYWIPVSNGDIIVPYITCNIPVQISGSVWGTNEFGTNTLLQSISWTNNGKAIKITNSGYLIILIRKADNSDISTSEVDVAISKPTNSITIPAPDGTIYGGTLDVESGELVVDRKMITLSSSISFEIQQTSPLLIATTTINDMKLPSSVSAEYIISDKMASSTSGNKDRVMEHPTLGLCIVVTNVSNLTQLNTWLDTNTPKLVYELATPKTYHLSPHQVKLLQGANIVTTNGTSLSLTYRDGEVAGLDDLNGLAESIEGIANPIVRDISSEITVTSGTLRYAKIINNILFVLGNTDSGLTSVVEVLKIPSKYIAIPVADGESLPVARIMINSSSDKSRLTNGYIGNLSNGMFSVKVGNLESTALGGNITYLIILPSL